jgi:hypothetical protein
VIAASSGTRSIELAHEEDLWTVDGRALTEADGCVDVDLRVTPANSKPTWSSLKLVWSSDTAPSTGRLSRTDD